MDRPRTPSDPFGKLLEVEVRPAPPPSSPPSESTAVPEAVQSSASIVGQRQDSTPASAEKDGRGSSSEEKEEERKVRIHEDGSLVREGSQEGAKATKDVLDLPPVRRRRRSTVVGPEHAGCYLIFDKTQRKWVGQWSSEVLDDAVAFMLPKVKVPQFKYNKKEKVVFQTDRAGITMRDERKDFLQGLCLFVKLTKDYQGLFLIISKSDLDERKLKLLGLGEKKELKSFTEEDVFYPASDLVAVAVLPASTISFSGKSMETPIFAGLAEQEGGFAVTFDTRHAG